MNLYYSTKIGDPQNTVYHNKTADLNEAIKWDHVMSKFRGNKRLIENFQSCDCLYGDVDNGGSDDWMTINSFNELLKGYEYAIVTSRNHMKDKRTGSTIVSARPRFHVYFPIKKVDCAEQLSDLLQNLCQQYPFFDKKSIDVGRMFFGNPDAQVYECHGRQIDEVLSKALSVARKPVESKRSDIKAIEVGERNDSLFKIGCKWIKTVPAEDLEAMLQQANDLLPEPLSQKEVQNVIKSVQKFDTKDDDKIIKNYKKVKKQIKDSEGNYRTVTAIEQELAFTDSMANPTKLFYSFVDGSGKKYMFQREGADYFLTDHKELHYILSKAGYLLDFSVGKEISEAKYLIFLREQCQSYERITCLPELNIKPDTLYRGTPPAPMKNGSFRQFIETLTLESLVDKYRYASGLLSGFLDSSFDGEKPLFSIIASSSNSGKSYSARTGCKILTGKNPIECRGNEKDELQHSGMAAFQNPFVIYDNLQDVSKEQLLNITLRVTDKMIPSHIMYVSHSRIKNGKTYWCTFNSHEAVNTDVVNRMLPIRMKDGREVSPEEKNKISEALIEMENKREEILADVLHHLQAVNYALDVPVKKHPKFPRWSIQMAKMLSSIFPEVTEFDFSLSDEDQEFADDRMLLEEFLEGVLGDEPKKFVPISDLVDKWRETNKSQNTTASSLTRRMKNMQSSLKKYRISYGDDDNKNKRGWSIKKVVPCNKPQ